MMATLQAAFLVGRALVNSMDAPVPPVTLAVPVVPHFDPVQLTHVALRALLGTLPQFSDPDVQLAVLVFMPAADGREAMGFACTCSEDHLKSRLYRWTRGQAFPMSRTSDGQRVH